MYKGTIVENSLADTSILQRLQIARTWQAGSWTLHDVLITEEQIPKLAQALGEGPWYIHVWESGKDEVKVIFREKIFTIVHSDRSTWTDAVTHGLSLGIPVEQLDFVINE